MPDNDAHKLVGRMVRLLWEMHHRVALEHPKMGELVAFRAHLVEYVSELSVVDEASVEDIVRSKGYELAYVPDAIVPNHGPEKLREYFEQRRRIARGHYWLEFAFGYEVATLDGGVLLKTALDMCARRGRLRQVARSRPRSRPRSPRARRASWTRASSAASTARGSSSASTKRLGASVQRRPPAGRARAASRRGRTRPSRGRARRRRR